MMASLEPRWGRALPAKLRMAQPPICSVITGATSLEQVLQNVTAASWTLTKAEVDEVQSILGQGRTPA